MSITNLLWRILPPALLGIFLYVVGGDAWIPEMGTAADWKWLGILAGALWLASVGPKRLGAITPSANPGTLRRRKRRRFLGIQIAAATCLGAAIGLAFVTNCLANSCCGCAKGVAAGVCYAAMHTFIVAGLGMYLFLAIEAE